MSLFTGKTLMITGGTGSVYVRNLFDSCYVKISHVGTSHECRLYLVHRLSLSHSGLQ